MNRLTTIRPDPFYDRTQELAALGKSWRISGPRGQLALLSGRRRLGKTYLLQRFFAGESDTQVRNHCYFLAEQTTAPEQRRLLAAQVLEELPDPGISAEELAVSWNAILRHVSAHCRAGERFGLVLDEFPYLVAQSPDLPSILQAWWDREGTHSRVFLILCGSQLSAMAALGTEAAPLYGRFNAGKILLEPLRYDEAAAFYRGNNLYHKRDILVMYGVLGGTPRYHALVDTALPPDDAMVDVLLLPHGPLENEVQFLLSSEQIRNPASYNAVLTAIATGETEFGKIINRTGLERGAVTGVLDTLLALGWIRRERAFGEATDRRSLYQVADPFLTFWYRFMARLASELQFNDPRTVYQERVKPLLADYMGRSVFESICHQWLRRHAKSRLGLTLRSLGRYWSRDGQLEIDALGELDDGSYVIGECKWTEQGQVGLGVLADIQAKVARLPEARYRQNPTYVLFSTGLFAPELRLLAGLEKAPDHGQGQPSATKPNPALCLVGLDDLLF